MKFFMRYLGMIMVVSGVLIFGSLMGASVFAGWVLGSQAGARWVIDWLPRAGLMDLQVEAVEGRLLGPLQLQGLVLKTPGADVVIDTALLEWSPLALVGFTARVKQLQVANLEVSLRNVEPPEDESLPPSIPQLPLGIEVRELTIARLQLNLPPAKSAQAQQQIIENIALDAFSWKGDKLSARRLSVAHQLSGPIEAALDARLASTSVELKKLTVNTAGDAPMRITATGLLQLQDGDSLLELNWSQLRWPLEGDVIAASREGQMRFEGNPQDLRLQGAFALGEKTQFKTKARYQQEHIDAQLNWTAFQWPLTGTPQVASERGSLEFKGKPEDYRYELEALLAAEGQQGQAVAKGGGTLEQLIVDVLQLDVARSHISGKAKVNWKSDLNVDADLTLKDVNPGLVLADWPGQLNGGLKARTEIRDGVPEVTFELALKNSKLRQYPLKLDAVGQAKGSTVNMDRLHLVSGATEFKARGQVTPPFNAKSSFNSPDLAALLPDLAGNAQLALELRGDLEAPHLIAVGEINQLAYQDLRIEQIALDADVDIKAQWNLDFKAQKLRGPTAMRLAQIRLKGTADDHLLNITVDAEPGTANLEARGALNIEQKSWAGQILQGLLAPSDLAPWTLEEAAALRINASNAQLEPACWRAGSSRLCLQGLREAERLRGALRVEKFDFAYFARFMPAGWTMNGGVDGTAVAEQRSGKWVEARADLATQPLSIERSGETILSAERGSLQLSETDTGTELALHLPVKDGRVNLDATLAAGVSDYAKRPLQGTLDLLLPDLAILRIVSTEIEQASGALEGRVDWSGTVSRPQAAGEIKLIDGRVLLATPGIELTDIAANFGASPDQSVNLSASAKSGGGEIRLTGEALLSEQPLTAKLHLTGKDFQAANMTEARAWINPDLSVLVKGPDIKVTGTVTVPRADITPVSFDSGVGPSSDQVIIRGEEKADDTPASRLTSDIKVVLGDKVSFEGFGLKTKFAGSLRATEKPGRPGLGRGEIRMVGGHYKAYGQNLEIDTGRVIFNVVPLTEPAVEIRAIRNPAEDIEVGVLVRGTLDAPEFQLFSTPAMPRERQLSWLVLGRSIEEGSGGDERQALANAALALGLARTDSVANNLKGGLNLDDVSIGSKPGEDASQASLTVGKYLSPKLYVSYGVGLFQPGQVFKLLYDLGRGFKVATESGVQTGGDLLYSVESD